MDRALLFVLLTLCTACVGAPERLPVPDTSAHVAGASLPLVLVRIGADMRPLDEHGTFKALGNNKLQHRRFAVPTLVEVADTVAGDLVQSGVAARALIAATDPPYILELDILHLGAELSGGVELFLVFAPTCALTATCELRWKLEDRHGRRFLDLTTVARLEGQATPLAGLEGDAAKLLGAALRKACDDGLPRLLPAVDAWWLREGLPPRREPLVNPLPVPRSSTDR